jgi:hypothetical protein
VIERRWILVGLLITCTGCDEVVGLGLDVRFEVQETSYARGDAIRATLANHSPDPVIYNLCGTALDRWNGSDWAELDPSLPSASNVCAAVAYGLVPGQIVLYTDQLPADIAPGSYRLRTSVRESFGPYEEVITTATFTVRD